jgi:periplasmic protein TonB
MRRSVWLAWVLVAAGVQTPFALGQTQAAPPVDGTNNAPAAPAGELAPPPVTLKPIGPMRISGGVMAGERISFVPPVYPEEAKSAKLSGSVVLRVIISKDGAVENAQVMSATNHMFDQASIDAVKQWRYKPFLLNGQPTEVDTSVMLNFSLKHPTKW